MGMYETAPHFELAVQNLREKESLMYPYNIDQIHE